MKCQICGRSCSILTLPTFRLKGWNQPTGWRCLEDGTIWIEFPKGDVRLVVNLDEKPSGVPMQDWLDNQYSRLREIR